MVRCALDSHIVQVDAANIASFTAIPIPSTLHVKPMNMSVHGEPLGFAVGFTVNMSAHGELFRHWALSIRRRGTRPPRG